MCRNKLAGVEMGMVMISKRPSDRLMPALGAFAALALSNCLDGWCAASRSGLIS
jgi:hypothetical protein